MTLLTGLTHLCKTDSCNFDLWTPPGVKHWHGGTAENDMTHIAAQEAKDGENVVWMEQVTDEQYLD